MSPPLAVRTPLPYITNHSNLVFQQSTAKEIPVIGTKTFTCYKSLFDAEE